MTDVSAVTSPAPYLPRAYDRVLAVMLAMGSGVIAGFPAITDDFQVTAFAGVTIGVGIVGTLGILGCWIAGSFSVQRPARGVPWIVIAVVLWVAQIPLLLAVGWRIAIPTLGFLAAVAIVIGWLQLHRYVAPAYAWIGFLVIGAAVAAFATSYPVLVAALVVTPLLAMAGATATQAIVARGHSAAA